MPLKICQSSAKLQTRAWSRLELGEHQAVLMRQPRGRPPQGAFVLRWMKMGTLQSPQLAHQFAISKWAPATDEQLAKLRRINACRSSGLSGWAT